MAWRPGAERRVNFGQDWRFFKGDAAGAQRPEFNDSSWRRLDLPHDWAIEGPFDSRYDSHLGGLPVFGIGWYRKRFATPAGGGDRQYSIEFDGVMSNSTVWLNGKELGGRPYGYSSFGFDITQHLNRDGKENVLAVRAAPEDKSSRWYPGAGIYRNVWLRNNRSGARRAVGNLRNDARSYKRQGGRRAADRHRKSRSARG